MTDSERIGKLEYNIGELRRLITGSGQVVVHGKRFSIDVSTSLSEILKKITTSTTEGLKIKTLSTNSDEQLGTDEISNRLYLVFCDSSGGDITITLPDAADSTETIYFIKRIV